MHNDLMIEEVQKEQNLIVFALSHPIPRQQAYGQRYAMVKFQSELDKVIALLVARSVEAAALQVKILLQVGSMPLLAKASSRSLWQQQDSAGCCLWQKGECLEVVLPMLMNQWRSCCW